MVLDCESACVSGSDQLLYVLLDNLFTLASSARVDSGYTSSANAIQREPC